MVTNIVVHLTHLRLSQISQTYLKIFVCLEHLMQIHTYRMSRKNNFDAFKIKFMIEKQ